MGSAPADNYNSVVKAKWRDEVWSWVDRVSWSNTSHRHVLIVDTGLGLETRHLLARGYRPNHIHVANKNPAEVAVLTRRLDADLGVRVNTYGVEFSEASRRVASKLGRVPDVMSFDGCGPVLSVTGTKSSGVVAALEGVPRERGVIMIANALVGRESGIPQVVELRGVKTPGRGWDAALMERAQLLGDVLVGSAGASGDIGCSGWHASASEAGTYVSSSGQRFLWCGVRLEAHRLDQHRSPRAWMRWFDCGRHELRLRLVPQCVTLAALERCTRSVVAWSKARELYGTEMSRKVAETENIWR